jgi:predicted phage tail protein
VLLALQPLSALRAPVCCIGGIAQLLTPTPSTSTDEGDPRKSFSFSGIQNTNRAGVPVPVIYGETLTGSVVISAGIDIVQVSA